MIVDAFVYNGEQDMLKLHINALAPYVDRFIILESGTTFSGNIKPLYFMRHAFLVEKHKNKIQYITNKEDYNDAERERALKSPNTHGASHWKREFMQKERLMNALGSLRNTDTAYIGDVDEIWDPQYKPTKALEKLKMRVYAYYMDNASSEEFYGPIVGKWQEIKNECLNHLRSNILLANNQYAGWHFTNMGGLNEVRRKLNDSYTTESYNTYEVQKNLPERVREGKDYLGRHFTFHHDTENWPQYLKDNRKKYAHLCRGIGTDHTAQRGAYGL